MKELTIEQKARAYDKAIEKARKLATDLPNGRNDRIYHIWDLESIFPELRESEDERIRKELIEFVKSRGGFKQEYIAWLEKQGEQMSDPRYCTLDKLIEADDIYQMSLNDAMVEEAKNKAIEALSKLEISKLLGLEKQGEQNPAWSEEDKEMCQETIDWFEKKCFPYALENDNPARESIKWLKSLKDRVQPKQEWSEEDEKMIQDIINDIAIAQEQVYCKSRCEDEINWLKSLRPQNTWKPSDEQMLALKEAGYEWDAENLQLTKILHVKELSDGINIDKQKSAAWSEEDEEYINDLIGVFDGQQYQAHSDEEIVKWLKSIRLPYNKEWDENDEEMLRSIIATCELVEQDRDSSPARHLLEMQLNWLKSLKQRIAP